MTRGYLADNLAADGFSVATAAGAGDGLRAIEVRGPDLVLLDPMIEANGNGAAGAGGLDLLDRIRAADGLASRIDPDLPVIVLSARGGEADRVRGLVRGADDFVTRPFSYLELLARIRAVMRRCSRRQVRGLVRVGELTLDPQTRRVHLGGRPIHLSTKEFCLLQALAVDPTRVCTKAELLRDVWGYMASGNTRTVDAHACRLRKKLAGTSRRFVVNVRGIGYRLTDVL